MNRDERIAQIKSQIEREKRAEAIAVKDYWENLPPLIDPSVIPNLPIVPEQEWKEYYVPKLIAAGAIPKDQLVDGEYYHGKHRCTRYAQWNAKENVFNYWKWKFGPRWDRCNHFEDDDHFALFVPIAIATKEQFDETGKPKPRITSTV
jgi:hypothetical protein